MKSSKKKCSKALMFLFMDETAAVVACLLDFAETLSSVQHTNIHRGNASDGLLLVRFFDFTNCGNVSLYMKENPCGGWLLVSFMLR